MSAVRTCCHSIMMTSNRSFHSIPEQTHSKRSLYHEKPQDNDGNAARLGEQDVPRAKEGDLKEKNKRAARLSIN